MTGTKDDPWQLVTAPGSSEYSASAVGSMSGSLQMPPMHVFSGPSAAQSTSKHEYRSGIGT